MKRNDIPKKKQQRSNFMVAKYVLLPVLYVQCLMVEPEKNIIKLITNLSYLTEQHNTIVFNSSCATITTCHIYHSSGRN